MRKNITSTSICSLLAFSLAFCTVNGARATSWQEEFYAAHAAENNHDQRKAERLYLAALGKAESPKVGDPTEVLITIRALVELYMSMEDFNKAEAFCLRELKLAEQLSACDDDKIHALTYLGQMAKKKRDFDRAENMYLRALKMIDDPNYGHRDRVKYSRDIRLPILLNLAEIGMQSGQLSKAETYFRKALPQIEEREGACSPEAARVWHTIDHCCLKQNNVAASISAREHILAIDQKLEPNGISVSQDLERLALLYSETKRFDKAEHLAKLAFAIRRKLLKPTDRWCVQGKLVLAIVYSHAHKFDLALPLFKEVQKMAPIAYGSDKGLTSSMTTNFANAYVEDKKYSEAIPLFEKALAIQKTFLAPGDSTLVVTVISLADAYLKVGEKQKAKRLCQSSLENALAASKSLRGSIETLRIKLAECQ